MTTLEILQDLQAKGVELTYVDGSVNVRAPKSALTPEVRTTMQAHKDGLLALLQGVEPEEEEEEEAPTLCYGCTATVECYSELGVPYCATHWKEHIETAPTLTFVQEVTSLGEQWDAEPPARLVLDLETTGLDPRTHKAVSIAVGTPEHVTIIDLRGYYRASPECQQSWRKALQSLLQRDTTLWIGHNLKFDWSFLAQQFRVKLKQVYDTMLVEKLLHVGSAVSVSLLASAQRYGIVVSKEPRSWFIDLDRDPFKWNDNFPAEQLAYMRQDIAVCYEVYERQKEGIERLDLAQVVALENRALPAIATMELRGVKIDVGRWRDIIAARTAQEAALEERIQQLLISPNAGQETLFGEKRVPRVQLTSPTQLTRALQSLGITIGATSREALQEVQRQHEVIPLLIRWKGLEKFQSAFGESLLRYVARDGRIHATFDQLGATSGRIVCREPNLQQVPRPVRKDDPHDLRRCIIAPGGYKLVSADLSNIELRILAEISGDATMLRFFAEGKDLHSETARLMFKLGDDVDPREHLINGKGARDIAKTINFGLAYGMGAQGLATRIGVDLATARGLMRSYFATYREVAVYLERAGKESVACGYVQSLSGRKRFFTREELRAGHGEAERSAKNHPIQGTNADILKVALALLYERLPKGAYIVLAVHDEIVLECLDVRVKEVTSVLREVMVQACRVYLKVVSVPEVDVVVGGYWMKW